MPNYRQKNRNRNKNKLRNKQQQQQPPQQQQHEEQQHNKNCKKVSEEPSSATTTSSSSLTTSPTGHDLLSSPPLPSLDALEVQNASALLNENVAVVGDNLNELQLNEPDVTTVAAAPTTTTSDTVSNELAKCNNENNYGVILSENMGNEKSKFKENQEEIPQQQEEELRQQHETITTTSTTTSATTSTTCPQGKVIVHRIICEEPLKEIITNKTDLSAKQQSEKVLTTSKNTSSELTTLLSSNKHEEISTVRELVTNDQELLSKTSKKHLATLKNSATTDDVSPERFKVIIHKILTPEEEIPEKSFTEDLLTKKSEELASTKKDEKQDYDKSELATLKNSLPTQKQETEVTQKPVKVIIHKISTPDEEVTEKSFEGEVKLTKTQENSKLSEVNKQSELATFQNSSNNNEKEEKRDEEVLQQHQVKVLVHQLNTPKEEEIEDQEETSIDSSLEKDSTQHQVKVIVHKVQLEHHDELPQITSHTMKDPLVSTSQVKIREMELDESLSDLEELFSPVISEAESSLEYYDELSQQPEAITDISSSSSSTPKQSRKQKRIALETHFLPQMINPRFLDSISEENSELSDNSENPLSRSASADSTNHSNDAKANKLNARFPKSSLDFSKPHKHQHTTHLTTKVIREEPIAMAVEARIQDTPDADESCTTLRSCMSPEAEAAEVVYINSASSSMTDLQDLELLDNGLQQSEIVFDLDTDLREIINKPKTETICYETLTSSSSTAAETKENTTTTTSRTTSTRTTSEQQLPEFSQNLNNNNNQIINNSKRINNNSTTPFTSPLLNTTTSTGAATSPLTTPSSSSLLAATSIPANAQQVFAEIEEQLSAALNSINETETRTLTAINSNLSNTQNCPVTTKLATKILETSCESLNTNSSLRADNNANIPQQVQTENVNMNTVRDLININNNNNEPTLKINDLKFANPTTELPQDDPKKLRLLCTETLAALPYGDEVLEELATVAQNIGEVRAAKLAKSENNMPYPLPELPHINDLQLSLGDQAPNSDESWLGVPTSQDPKVLVCLSPSQRSYIQQNLSNKPDDLLDAHQKFMERRGYHEFSQEQLKTMEQEKLAEQQLLQTAAVMKKLRKSITPPPPQIPPPPVPVKSSETLTKAQNLSKRSNTTNLSNTHTTKTNNDVANSNNNQEHTDSSMGEFANGEEYKHRLLSIIQDTSPKQENNKQIPLDDHSKSSKSNENNSRQSNVNTSQQISQVLTLTNGSSQNNTQFPQTKESKDSGNMQSVEQALGQMFPSMGSSNIFDDKQKRFSNIENSTQQLMETQPKRYSSVETHFYESKKRLENGKLVEDFSTSKHDIQNSGDDKPVRTEFPLKTPHTAESNTFTVNNHSKNTNDHVNMKTKTDDQDIMSALNLNKPSSTSLDDTKSSSETTIKTTFSETSHHDNGHTIERQSRDDKEKEFVRKELESNILKRGIQDTYEEFRQRAKAAADAATLPTISKNDDVNDSSAAVETIAKVTSKGDNGEMISSTTTTTKTTKKTCTLNHEHEKLFKEFDDLSKQLHKELESSKAQREQREKSASMFDLNRVQLRQKDQIQEFNKSRHDHMKELEEQIDRSMRSRSMKFTRPHTSADVVDYTNGPQRTYEIPIQIENGYTSQNSKSSLTNEEAPTVPPPPRTYQIPVQIENSTASSQEEDSRYRRAESMFNLSDDMHQRRQRSYSNQHLQTRTEDDWSKYASDLGSSENIARPFAKEVEICYQRRPGGIRAPRISASTNDLSYGGNNIQTYDQYNAYNVRRSQAPMLNRAPQHSRPQFGSCYSMIERDPNPKYISTTTRRGVSPAPQSSGFFPLEGCHVKDEEMRQRRASLPRELHEQQLKYITSKEEELRMEFERLQNERRRLMEETHQAKVMEMSLPLTPTTPTTPTRPLRDHYRSSQKLPTLTEDEVFRQQMAEEWLNKVAEREKRRLQNIIKISKITDDEEALSKHKANMEEEFLSRVKERRCKLAMPADSDWESGAESHPNNTAQFSETEEAAPIKVLQGESVANVKRLPAHLREFAKFSNHQRDEIEGGHREQHQEEESSHETTDNSVSKAFKKSTVVKTVKTLRAPMLPAAHSGQDPTKIHYTKPRAYQIPPRIRDTQSSERIHRKNLFETRRSNKQTRFAEPSTNRRSWSESDLLEEIDKELKLAKGFLFQDVYNVKHEYMSEPETDNDRPRKMAQLGRRQYDGIGPITNDGMPIILRSEVKEPHQHEWYKRLYQTIHKQKHGEDCVIRYKQQRGRNPYNKPNGYQSEPEPNYDSDYSTIKYRTVNPNRLQSVSSALNVRNSNDTLYGTLPHPVKSGQISYKNQPGRIEDYTTGHSSVSEKEKKEWWDEVMDIFNVQFDQAKLSSHYTEGNLSRALAKESGYTSDSNLVFRKKEIPPSSPLSPVEQKLAYKNVQAGGEPPLFGFRKPAPEKSKVSPNRYYESDVNIHFKTPVRQEFKYPISEEELAIRQAEHMQKLYQEERRRKYLQELQDMNSRRHTDNFTPSLKSPIALNRYDDFPADLAPKNINQVKSIARALYNFQAQNSKELSFKKGDIIYIKRAIDKNWYEGEHNAMIGLFPANYVEIINKETVYPVQPQQHTLRKPSEGQARAKYNFQAQSGVELSLNKGELVALTRRVDDNWFEGRIANRKGIFPVSYVEVLTDIGAEDIAARTTTIQHTSIVNARPSLDALRTNINNEFNTLTRNGNQPPNAILRETRNGHKTDILHVDTSSEPLVYRALYKYRPQNSDELELQEGDMVHVLEKCDDGWYVGTSQRTGCFGTFPGNYVERV